MSAVSPFAAALTVSGTISADTTWTFANSPVVVQGGDLVVAQGATLTVEPGVVVKIQNGRSIGIYGVLVASGTLEAPIFWTSLQDDSVGGNTNLGPEGETGSRGDWVGIQFVNAALPSRLSHFRLRYAGGLGTQFVPAGSENGQIASLRLEGAAPILENGEIVLGAADGIKLDATAGPLSLNAVYVASHNAVGLNALDAPSGLLTLQGGRFGNNNGAAIRINRNVFPVDLGGNALEYNNGTNAILVQPGQMTSSGTWPALFPYVITGDLEVGNGNGGVTWTLDPGVIVKTNHSIGVRDILQARGVLGSPVLFTSRRDNAAGGVTEDPAWSPDRGNWMGLQLSGAAGASRLDHVKVRYAGGLGTQFVPAGSDTGQIAALRLISVSPSITGGEVFFSAADGIRLQSGASPAIVNLRVVNNVNGIVAETGAAPVISFSSISANSGFGVKNLDAGLTLDARSNWWGAASGPTHASNPGGTGDAVSNFVDYSGFLSSPPILTASLRIVQSPYTKNLTVTLILAADEAQDMILSEDPAFTGAAYAAFNTTAAFTLSAGDGLKTVYAKFRSAGGAETPSVSAQTTLDTAAPFLAVTSPQEGLITNQDVAVMFVSTDNLTPSGQILVRDGQGGSPPFLFTAEGVLTATLTATDLALNASTAAVSFTIDKTAPPAVADLRASSVPTGAEVLWTAPQDNLSGVARYFLYNAPSAAFDVGVSSEEIPSLVSPGGTVAFTVMAATSEPRFFKLHSEDRAGNLSGFSNTALLDLAPPVITSLDLAEGAILSRVRTVTASASDNVAVARLVFRVDGAEQRTCLTSPCVFNWDTRLFADGAHGLSVTAEDSFGNQTSAARSVTVSYVPPPAPAITAPSNGFATGVATLTVAGVAEAGTTVQILVNGLDLATASVNGAGAWSVLAVLPREDNVVLTAIAFEARGFSSQSAPVTGVYTTAAPDPPGNVSASVRAGGQVLVGWAAPINKTPAFYRVYRSTDEQVLAAGTTAPAASRVGNNVTGLSFTDTPALDGLYFYGVTALDGALNESMLSQTVYALNDRVPPSAAIQFTTSQPVGMGTYRPELILSEVLATPPILTFTPQGGQPLALNLEAVTATLWRATVTITEQTPSGTASFAFQGTDLAGNVGTSLSSRTLVLDTGGPSGTVTLSKLSPVSTGSLEVFLELDEAPAAPPVLSFTPQGGSAVGVLLFGLNQSYSGTVFITSTTGDGNAVFSYAAYDFLGNVGTKLSGGTTFFNIDTTAPGSPISVRANPAPEGKVVVTWSAPFGERPAYYRIYRDEIRLSTVVVPAPDGSGMFEDYPGEGLHTHQISSVDLAGNESALTDPPSVADATPPPAPVNLTGIINGFGQVQLEWQAVAEASVTYRLYRATFTVLDKNNLTNVLRRAAASPFVESPAADGVYHYSVTALDLVGNESSLSGEVLVVYDKAAPVISFNGVTPDGFHKTDVFPTFTVFDASLDTASVRSVLDGVPFVSGSTISAEGFHTLTVTASDLESHSSTATVTFVLDKTAPSIIFAGVPSGSVVFSSVAVSVVVVDLNPATSSFLLTNQTLAVQAPYGGEPITRDGQYLLEAFAADKAGNSSTATLSFRLDAAPVAPMNLSVRIEGSARLAWTKPEPDVIAYRVYRDGQRISSSLHPDVSFEDSGLTAGAHVYEVSAIDARGAEGLKARAAVADLALSLAPVSLTRGFFDALRPQVRNNSGASVTVGPALVELLTGAGVVATATAPAVSAPFGQTGTLEGVVAVPTDLPAALTVRAAVSLPTDPGASVTLAGSFAVSAKDPQAPLLEVFPDALVPGTESPVQVRLYNRGSAPMDVVTAEVLNSTFAAVEDVRVLLRTSEGTLFGYGNIKQTAGTSAALIQGRQVFFVSVPPGGSFLFDGVRVLVPNTVLTELSVEAVVSTPTYNLPFAGLKGTRGFAGAVAQGVVGEVPYRATAQADRAFYDQGSTVTITGLASDPNGFPIPNAAVAVHVVSNGFDRHHDSVTDSSGSYRAVFTPLPNEAGSYSVTAGYPSVVTHAVQSSFTIVGFGFGFSSFKAVVAQNSAYAFTVDLVNTGASSLEGLSASTAVLSGSGVTLSLDPATLPSSLAAGAKAALALTVSALPSASTSQMTLTVAESHGFTRVLPITAEVFPAQVIAQVTPQQFQLGIIGGEVRTQAVTIKNVGFDTWRGVSLTSPALPWVRLQGSTSAAIGDILPGGNANFTLIFEPPLSLPNGTYAPDPLLQITSLNVAPVPVQAAIAVTSARKGDVLVSVIDADKPRNAGGQGVPVPAATVTLVSLEVSGLTFKAAGDLNGLGAFSQVPSGNYAWRAEAKGYQTVSGTMVVEPGLQNKVEAILATAVVTYEWSVTPTTIVDRYNVTLNLTFRTDVPAPVIIMDPPTVLAEMASGQEVFAQITVKNLGLVSAFDVELTPEGPDTDLDVILATTIIPELKPGQIVSVPVKLALHTAPVCHEKEVACKFWHPCAAGIKKFVKCLAVKVLASTNQSCGTAGTPGTPAVGGGSGGTNLFIGDGATVSKRTDGKATQISSCNGSPGKKPKCQRCLECPGVDPAQGFLTQRGKGHGLPPHSLAPEYLPSHYSDDPQPGETGAGWTRPGSRVTIGGDGVDIDDEGGGKREIIFFGPISQPINGSGPQFALPVQYFDRWHCTTQACTQTEKDGTVTKFQKYGGGPIEGGPGTSVPPETLIPVEKMDRNGNTLTYEHDADLRPTKVTDNHGRFMSYAYNAQGKLSAVTDSTGRSITYEYDTQGDRISETDPNGDITRYAYSSHRITEITYPNGGKRTFTYDGQGRVLTESDDLDNNKNTYVYNGVSSTTKVTDALNHDTVYHWIEKEGVRRITKIVDPENGEALFEYDAGLNMVKETDPLGRVKRFEYDANGNVTATTDPAGKVTQLAYAEKFNQVEEVADPKGNVTRMFHDAKGNLTQVQDANNNFTAMSYDQQGHVTATRDPLGQVTAFAYRADGALVSVTDPLGRTTNMTRDNLSRVTRNTDPGSKVTEFGYDSQGNLTQVKDAINGITGYGYDPGRPEKLLKTVVDAKNQTTTFGYDAVGRLTNVTNALSQAKNYVYDKNGNLSSLTDAKSQTITFEYDPKDRLKVKHLPEGNVTYQYDLVGNVTQISHHNGSVVEMTYDNLSRITQSQQTLPGGYQATISYVYDANGNRTQMSTPWGTFSYVYEALNRLTKITNPEGKVFAFNYDSLGRRTKLNYPNGIETTYAYDVAGQLTQILHRKTADNTAMAFANYLYDNAGNRVGMEDIAGVHRYTYDNLHRLTGATHPPRSNIATKNETFNYDGVGNRTADANISGYLYDAANRLLESSSFTYTHDANGNRTGARDKLTLQTTSYAYDSENQLKQVNLPAGTIFTAEYDGLGRRIEKSTGTAASQTTRYIYDGEGIVALLDGNNNLVAVFTQRPAIDERLMLRKVDGQEFFMHSDGLGNIVAHTDALGLPAERVENEVYGKTTFLDIRGPPISSDHSFTGSPYAFTARELDYEAGLYFHIKRYRDFIAGGFLTPEPGGLSRHDVNPYIYALNNPAYWVDPDGAVPASPPAIPSQVVHPPFGNPPPPIDFPPTPEPPPPNTHPPSPPMPGYCPARTPPKDLSRGYTCSQDTGDPGRPPHIVIKDRRGNVVMIIFPGASGRPPIGNAPSDIIKEALEKCGKGQFGNFGK